jgi:hypothetical protein
MVNSFLAERPFAGPLTALYSPMARTLAQARNLFKNLAGGLLVPWEVTDLAGLIGAGSSPLANHSSCNL